MQWLFLYLNTASFTASILAGEYTCKQKRCGTCCVERGRKKQTVHRRITTNSSLQALYNRTEVVEKSQEHAGRGGEFAL